MGQSLIESVLKNPKIFHFWLRFCDKFKLRVIQRYIKVDVPKTILDIGCAVGNSSTIFSKYSYVGIDLSEEYIEYSKKNFDRKFYTMDSRNMSFRSRSYDYVLISSVLHHCNDQDCKDIIKDCIRVLKDDGILLILEPSYPKIILNPFHFIHYHLERGQYMRDRLNYIKLFSDNLNINKSETIVPAFFNIRYIRHEVFLLKKK